MRALLAAASGAAIASFAFVIHADSPWFAPKAQEMFSVAASGVSINPGQELVLASVPSNRRLVVTSVFAQDLNSGLGINLELDQKDASGRQTVKFPRGMITYLATASATGVLHGQGEGAVFEPGTDVVLRMDSAALYGAVGISYFVGGYFVSK
jgi:hypothetical protein